VINCGWLLGRVGGRRDWERTSVGHRDRIGRHPRGGGGSMKHPQADGRPGGSKSLVNVRVRGRGMSGVLYVLRSGDTSAHCHSTHPSFLLASTDRSTRRASYCVESTRQRPLGLCWDKLFETRRSSFCFISLPVGRPFGPGHARALVITCGLAA
jgi:hypothetical protein